MSKYSPSRHSWPRRQGPSRVLAAALLALALLVAGGARADDAPAANSVPVVGVVRAAPFAMQDNDGNWRGIAVDLWRHVAQDLGIAYQFREMPVADLLAGLENGTLLAVITATASAEREMLVDFSHPYYSSGLAIAVPTRTTSTSWFAPLAALLSVDTLKITGLLIGLLVLAALLVWLCERRANPEHFDGRPARGIADGLWWAAVTLTTVGYGDKAPRTRVGRFIAVIWMFAAVILIALFTAQVTSALTVSSLGGRVRGPADLPGVRVGTVRDSQPQALLRVKFGVNAVGYPGFREGLDALARGQIDAFVGAEPVLRYEIAKDFPGSLVIVGTPFLRLDYVFAYPPGSPLRKPVNQSLLSFIDSDHWREILRLYLGGEG